MRRPLIALAGSAVLAAIALALFQTSPSPPPPPEPVATVDGPDPRFRRKTKFGDRPLVATGAARGDRQVVDLSLDGGNAPALQTLEPTPDGPPPTGPRLVLVTLDTVRADHFSAYGHPLPTTPTFDAFAQTGVLFERFLVPQATTLPTHLSLFTGTHPDEHGVTANISEQKQRYVPPESLRTLASHLGARGYRTAALVSSTPLKSHTGIAAGFQEWTQPPGRSRPGAQTTAGAVAWLKTVPADRPFFLWVHLFDPHAPYRSPPGYADLFTDQRPALRERLAARGALPDDPAEADKRVAAVRAYDSEIRYVDDQLARLLAALSERGWDDAIVVVVGDHGEGLGQHGHLEHGLIWREQLAAPLAIRAPGLAPRRHAGLTEAADLIPTLFALADWPDEAALLAQVSGRDALSAPERPVLSRTSDRQLRELQGGRGNEVMAWALNTRDASFIWRVNGEHSLYDLTSDPHALRDLAGERPDEVAARAREVEAIRAGYRARAAAWGAGRMEALAPGLAEELEALGYVE